MIITLPRLSFALCMALAGNLIGPATLNAQVQNCGLAAGSGGTLSTSQPTICADGSLWAPPTVSGYTAGLPNREYVFQDPSDIVYNEDSSAFGPRILAINSTGAFDPQAAGLADGDQFIVTAVTYDLADLQSFAQTLLNGSFLFTPCCTFAELVQGIDVCSVYNSVGIFNGSDVTGLGPWVNSILAFGGADALDNIIYSWDQINLQAGQPCTGSLPLCYATSTDLTVDIVCSFTCSTATPPSNPIHTNSATRVTLSWDPIPGSVACQLGAQRLTPPGPSPTQNLIGAAPTTTNIPYSLLGAGTTWRYRVRCACSITPTVDATGFSVWDTFSVPVAREMQELPEAVAASATLNIWPNPASTQLTVETGFGLSSLEIMDGLGRLRQVIQPQAWTDGVQTIALDNLEPGIYLLVARYEGRSGNPTETIRFSVQ